MRKIRRRDVLAGTGAAFALAAVQGCRSPASPGPSPARAQLSFPPLRASVDRITRITVCTRPFRAQGPRLDVEQIGQKTVVHNYGHGGSGWSLSWGSSAIASEKALATGERDIAVIGCGALGLTSALTLQRAGARVTIYAKDLPPNVRSSLASGLWTPDSRICFAEYATPAFKQLWADMARRSFNMYQSFLGVPGDPVEFIDSYAVFDTENMQRHQEAADARPQFAELQREMIEDLIPQHADFPPGTHPFDHRYLQRSTQMMFNLSAYSRLLMTDFEANGGKIEIADFHAPADFATLRQKTLVNATGYGARALFNDQSITPVRGQLARLIPQPEIRYGLFYKHVSFVPRRDGLVIQAVGENDYFGFNDASAEPNREEAALALDTIAQLFQPA